MESAFVRSFPALYHDQQQLWEYLLVAHPDMNVNNKSIDYSLQTFHETFQLTERVLLKIRNQFDTVNRSMYFAFIHRIPTCILKWRSN